MTATNTYGRQVVLPMTNKSGGSVALGDVVIVDTTNNLAFTTTTAGATTGLVGIAQETIASNATGRVLLSGYAALVNVNAAVTRGHYGATHTVAKQATDAGATRGAGTFCQFLTAGATPDAMVWPTDLGGGSGAPTTSEYVTTAADGGLSAEVAIPGLAGSADIAGDAGGGTAEEYDSGTTGLTWDVAPTTVDSDTTIKSHLYIATSSGQNQGTKAWAPAGAFDARAKVLLGKNGGATQAVDIAVLVGNSGLTDKVFTALHRTASTQDIECQAYTYTGGSYTQRGSTWPVARNSLYVRVSRDGSNNVSFWWSDNGKLWILIATQSFTFTVAKLGFRLSGDGTAFEAAADWLRTDV